MIVTDEISSMFFEFEAVFLRDVKLNDDLAQRPAIPNNFMEL